LPEVEILKTTIIFGASGSIGQAICTHFKEHAHFVIGVARNESAENSIINWSGNAQEFSTEIQQLLGVAKIDSVVWAQGINFNDDIDTFDLDRHLQMYEANVTYILNTLKALMQFDLLEKKARLCVISSIWQNIARQNKLSYCITKSALQGLVQSLSVDLGKQGMLINAVLPGALDTVMTRANLSQEQISLLESITPLSSLPNLSDVTGLVAYLCSSQNTGITGQFIAADRGFSNARIL
jgi:NAD(P)-dependent dehydrogenase (short-subunit alcohol dehydrogenase family)